MRFSWIRILLIGVFFIPVAYVSATPATQGDICFSGVPDISNCIASEFASYWQSNGGLPVFGYPLGPRTLSVVTPDTSALYVQWTERNRLESHPDAAPDYHVQLGRMGAERLGQLGRDPNAEPAESGPQDGCIWFAETRHNVCNQADGLGFRSYWESHGLQMSSLNAYQRSLALFGLPLTAAQVELSAQGEPILTQWFERARFEWHPGNSDEYKVLLGLLGRELQVAEPPAQTLAAPAFGVEINRGLVARVVNHLGQIGASQVRYNGILWADVEPNRGERQWASLAGIERELSTISAAGAAPMVIVRSTPTWAREVSSSECGPIKADALPDFAKFMGDLAARYSQPPYNVHYWELGNEPDIDPGLVGSNAPFGCWGNAQQADYGGAGYAAMLKAVYPAIKAADPQAKVIFGGMLLYCDPGYAGIQPCPSGSFFEGVLRAGGGDYFDILAYHAYPYWRSDRIDWDTQYSTWAHRGGLLIGKLQFLREVMSRYGIEKPVMMNEGSLLCYHNDPACAPGGFYTDQANYLVRLYTRAAANHIMSVTWFTLNGPGWQESSLLDSTQQPRLAYQTYSFLSGILNGASYVSGGVENAVEHHTFRKGNHSYTIYWTNDGSIATLPLPNGVQNFYTMSGNTSALEIPGIFSFGFEPVIIEIIDT